MITRTQALGNLVHAAHAVVLSDEPPLRRRIEALERAALEYADARLVETGEHGTTDARVLLTQLAGDLEVTS